VLQVEERATIGRAAPDRASWPPSVRGGLGPSARLWLASLGCSLAIILLFLACQRAEILLNSGRPRGGLLVAHASEMAMRVVGISHHLVAAFFLVTSARARTTAGRWWIAGLLAAGGALSVGFAAIGGHRNPLAMVGFIVAFVAHAFHDEIFFYREHARAAGREVRDPLRALRWLQIAAIGLLATALAPLSIAVAYHGTAGTLPSWLPFSVRIHSKDRELLHALLPGSWSPLELLAVFGLPCALVLGLAAARLLALRSAVRAHAPVVRVLAASVALTLAIGVLGLTLLNLVILMHFVSWFLFTTARLRRADATPAAPYRPAGVVAWLRGTRRGFWLLHGGGAAAVMALIAFDHYALGHRPIAWGGLAFLNPLAALLAADVFYYWTIVHVTLSLAPKGGAPARPGPLAAAAPA
jgi:hypothetical protein